MLRVKLGLYFNVLCEAESIKTAGYHLFKKYHDFFIQPAGPPLLCSESAAGCCIEPLLHPIAFLTPCSRPVFKISSHLLHLLPSDFPTSILYSVYLPVCAIYCVILHDCLPWVIVSNLWMKKQFSIPSCSFFLGENVHVSNSFFKTPLYKPLIFGGGGGGGGAVAQLVETLRYKPEGRVFDSHLIHWCLSGRTMALGPTQPLTEMSTRNISWR
jgi:hypothetical protein